MLDAKTSAVLTLIIDQVGNSYKILNKQQMVASLPKNIRMDNDNFNAIIMFLKENDYIDVKYQDKEQICLCATVKADAYKTGLTNVKQDVTVTRKQTGLLFALMTTASFLGAMIALVIYNLF